MQHPTEFGTMWWFSEGFWKNEILTYDQSSIRSEHPGLSVRVQQQIRRSGFLPVLYGRSKETKGGFKVDGFAKGKSKKDKSPSWFGSIINPAQYPLDRIPSDSVDNLMKIVAKNSTALRNIRFARPNPSKLKVDENEWKDMVTWCKKHKLPTP